MKISSKEATAIKLYLNQIKYSTKDYYIVQRVNLIWDLMDKNDKDNPDNTEASY